jgi:hypothetical protein
MKVISNQPSLDLQVLLLQPSIRISSPLTPAEMTAIMEKQQQPNTTGVATQSASNLASPTTTHTDEDSQSNRESHGTNKAEATPKSDLILSEDPFSSETSKQLFDAINERRRCGAGGNLNLPQVRLTIHLFKQNQLFHS